MTVSNACSLQRINQEVYFAMTKMGANQNRFSDVSARKRGLSTAIEAGIHEAVLFLQTGMVKRRRRWTICTFGTQLSSCKSSGCLNCECA